MLKAVHQTGAFIERKLKGRYILVMCNMYQPLFSMTFFDLGLDNKVSGRWDNCDSAYFKSSVKGGVFLR